MAVKVGELYGELKLDKKPFDKGLDDAEGKSKGWASRIAGTLGGAASALLKWGAVGGAVAGGGAFMLGNMASDLNETISKSQVVFGDHAGVMRDWSANAAQAMGLSTNEALGAASTFGNLFVAMKLGQDDAADMSQGIVELAGDLASFNNMDPTEVLDKLRAGLVGETEPLRSLGVNISAAATEAKALEMGLGGAGRELTAAEKATANYAIIMEQTTTAQGDFARTSSGMANQQRITAATFKDTLAGIGQAFIPLFEAILPQLTTALQGFGAWVTENMPTIQAVAENVVGAIGAAFTFVFTEVLPALVAAFEAAWPVIQTAMGIIGDAIKWVTENVIPPLSEVLAGLVEWVTANWPTISSIFQSVFAIVAGVVQTVWPIIEAIAKVLFPLVVAAASTLFKALDVIFKALVPVFEIMSGAVRAVWGVVRPIWETIASVATELFGVVGQIIDRFGDNFTSVFEGIRDIARTVWRAVESAVKGGINGVIDLINGLIGFMNNIRIPIPSVGIPGTDIRIGGGHFDPFNISRIPRLATGVRDFAGGLAMVGEQGPELVRLPGGADVFNHRETSAMLSGTVEVVMRDPDGAIARGGYDQSALERAVVAGVERLASGLAHRSIRVGEGF